MAVVCKETYPCLVGLSGDRPTCSGIGRLTITVSEIFSGECVTVTQWFT